MVDEQKQAKNLFKKLVNDQNSVFYSSDKITKTLNKGRKSSYEKDKVFYRIFNLIEDKDVIYDKDKPKLPFYTPFIEQKKDIDRSSSLYTIDGPIATFSCGRCLFTIFFKKCCRSEICFSLRGFIFMENLHLCDEKKSNLAQKMELFYKEIVQNRNQKEKMRLQVDLEFQQNEIKKLNEKYKFKCSVQKLEAEKLLQPNKKLENLKKIYLKVSVYINQQKLADSMQKNLLEMLLKI